MIGVISIGQAGCAVGDLFAKAGFKSLAINYSTKDLETCKYIDADKKLHLAGSEGVGKQREVAKGLLTQNWEKTVEFVRNHLSHASIDLIFCIFSTGGGTGSGIAPLILELLNNEFPNKTFVACPILPQLTESTLAQMNTLDCLKEISNLDICILPIDNEQFSNKSKNQIYEEINKKFVHYIKNIEKATEKHSKNGNLDKKDLISLFATKGFASISYINISAVETSLKLSREITTQRIQKTWSNSIFTPISKEKIIGYGLIFDGQEQLMKFIDTNIITAYFDNDPLVIFEGYYHEGKGDVYSILTGLQFNQHRLDSIENQTFASGKVLTDVVKQSHTIRLRESVRFSLGEEKKKKNVEDILKKHKL